MSTSTNIPPISVLFRYRDLVAHTLKEHRAMINQFQKVWWGWWRRPSEPSHEKLWEELSEATSHGQKVAIGLYDSGQNQVHVAWIDQVKRPVRDEYGEYTQVPLSPEELELVPSYYRTSPFSRAWMRIVKIQENAFTFFHEYSFAEPPPLPNFSQAELGAFKDKVILDGDELRNMDLTIWRVRPKQPTDKKERILTIRTTITEPVSRNPISTRGSLILHITDPHFAYGDTRKHHIWKLESESRAENGAEQTLAEAIVAALDEHTRSRIGLILVTGDLTSINEAKEFEEARYSLTRLYGILGLGPEHLVVIPGNHDIKWTNDSTYSHDAVVQVAPDTATEPYRKFYRDLFRHDPHRLLCMSRRYILPPGMVLDICALNSSSLETGKHFLAGMGRIQESSFQEVVNAMGWHESPGLALRLLALHHHLVPTEDLEPPGEYAKGFGMAIDAPRIQRLAAKYGVQLAMHGHKHRLFVWHSSVYELPEETQERWYRGGLSIIGGGSAGSTETDGGKNYFNLIDIKSDGITLQAYRSRNRSAFDPLSSWKARLSIQEGKLTLEPWLPMNSSPKTS